jgi:UDPglucose 6-dehydrogenase
MLIEEGIAEAGGEGRAEFQVVSNPEFLREDSAVHDTFYPDRVVLGSDSEKVLGIMRELYRPLIERGFEPVPGWESKPTKLTPEAPVPFVTTDLASAEMIKYAANAFLATKISFINEIANICELVDADVASVSRGIGADERIGPRFLEAGIGWGGSCFPKDVFALRSIAREYDYEPRILDATVGVNERQRKQVISKLQRELHTLKGKRIALLGLAFKPNTDDLRDAPSLYIARALNSLGDRVVGYEPVAGEAARRTLAASGTELKVAQSPYEALGGAHTAVLVTEWEEVRALDYAGIADAMEEPRVVVDGRNALDAAEPRAHGLRYKGFGCG